MSRVRLEEQSRVAEGELLRTGCRAVFDMRRYTSDLAAPTEGACIAEIMSVSARFGPSASRG